ncbi:hypothetical protein BGX34_007655, partial [Mortierella sp. NVP85]
ASDVEKLVEQVSTFLDLKNRALFGTLPRLPSTTGSPMATESSGSSHCSPTPSLSSASADFAREDSTSWDYLDDISTSRGATGTDRKHPFRLSAVIINPHKMLVEPIERLDVEAWRSCLDTNVTGTIQVTQQLLPLLRRTLARKARRSPRLILLTSAHTGIIGYPNQSALCASHHAIMAIADSLRREIGPSGIDVVCLKTGTSNVIPANATNNK